MKSISIMSYFIPKPKEKIIYKVFTIKLLSNYISFFKTFVCLEQMIILFYYFILFYFILNNL